MWLLFTGDDTVKMLIVQPQFWSFCLHQALNMKALRISEMWTKKTHPHSAIIQQREP